jgi:recombinational DNA repair protein (RecF pathway)
MPRHVITFTTPRQPRCPFCQSDLSVHGIYFRDGWAICSDCQDAAAVLPVHMLDRLREFPHIAQSLSLNKGILFYCPKDHVSRRFAAWLTDA